MADAPEWVPWKVPRWLVSCAEMDRFTEYTYFRLCMIAYESGSSEMPFKAGSLRMRCKSASAEEFEQIIQTLIELEKISIENDVLTIPTVEKVLIEIEGRREKRAAGAKKARAAKAQKKAENTDDQPDFLDDQQNKTDDQTGDQTDDQAKLPANIRQTDRQIEKQTDSSEAQSAVDLYNRLAAATGLSQCKKLTDQRKKKILMRLKDCGGLKGWHDALLKVYQSSYLRGDNPRKWRADLDFILSPSKFQRIVEGTYGGESKSLMAVAQSDIDGGDYV